MIGHFKLKNGFILLFLSCIWSTAQAQSGTRYAFVNMEYIFSCIPDYAKAQQELDDYSQKLQADIDAVYAEIAEMQSRYNADKVFLTPSMREDREKEIAAKENKVQELTAKYEALPKDIHWHMIGHLQTNKVKYIIDKAELIHSVDSLKLAETIEKEAAKHDLIADILVEVNVAEEESKFGMKMEEVIPFVEKVSAFPHVRVRGLMTIAPFVEDPEENRSIFADLHKLYIDIKKKNHDNDTVSVLSMGMTNDYEVAIEEGATMVRVGTGIFGARNYVV